MSCFRSGLKLLNNGRFVLKRTFAVQISQASNEVNLEHLEATDNGIAVLSLNREKQRNALSFSLVKNLDEAVNNIAISNAKVLIIKSSVSGTFCAGADLKERLKMSPNEAFQCSNGLRSLFARVNHLHIPVIAALDGLALGGGLELALACDIRVAVSTAKIGLVETKLAIIPGAGGTARLPRLINPAIAKELIFTAKIIDGAQAKDLGIVNHAIQQNENGNAAYLKALEIAREILPNGPVAIKMAKFAINKGTEVDIDSALAIEQACYAQIIPTEDRVEGLQAFSEKRPPKYLGI